ncbi:hypothetical protein CGCS363_v012046 [Colletotrichum siamense]|uniref:uncharacterized protein n=1 Tax=Colletotrichum siamense TaxID=690259 RepID=UPI001872C115|nr:uncharacterized protein CGCS363_v012046 [Colletotrichum siamense]KAF5490115.1 hypothetical protein CGCS363_v012046 [Colletotrichum siamense]
MEPDSEHAYELLRCPLPPSSIHLLDTIQDIHPNSRASPDTLQRIDTDHASSEQLTSPPDLDEDSNTHLTAIDCHEGSDRDEHSSPKSESDQTRSPVHWNGLPWSRFLGDIIAIALSLCFLALGVCICSIRGQEESEWSKKVIVATELAPSFWPVIFSGVVGNALKAYANWHLERGVPLRALEQVLGSLTMANTVLSAYALSMINIWTVCLFFVWAFNPLGSQSSFRSLYLQNQVMNLDERLSYKNYALKTIESSALNGSYNWLINRSAVNAAYSSVLTSATSGTQYCNSTCIGYDNLIARLGGIQAAAAQMAIDPWGSPRVPSLKHVAGFDASNPEKWLDVPWNQSVQNYCSLIGNRVHGIKTELIGNVSFPINASYIDLHDVSSEFSAALMFTFLKPFIDWFAANYKSFTEKYNATLDHPPYEMALEYFFGDPSRTKRSNTFSLDYNTTYGPGTQGKSNTTIFVGAVSDDRYCMTSCAARTIYVNVEVFCEYHGIAAQSQCRVDRIRQLPEPPLSPLETIFSPKHVARRIPDSLMIRFPPADAEQDRGSSFSETFIENPVWTLKVPQGIHRVEWSIVPMEIFADRFGLLLNTFLDSTVDPQAILGGMPENKSWLLNTTSAVTIPLAATYALDTIWIVVYFISTTIMLTAALAGLVFHYHSDAPQILGFVGSLAKTSPHFAVGETGGNSTESGEAVSRRLGDTKVMVLDEKPDEAVGRIAFAPMSMGDRVQRGRWYD